MWYAIPLVNKLTKSLIPFFSPAAITLEKMMMLMFMVVIGGSGTGDSAGEFKMPG